jgi:hypothetical protein
MIAERSRSFTAPVFVAVAFFIFFLAILEKALNVVGLGLPLMSVYPRQMLDWAVTLLVFDIALTLRQVLESRLAERR